MTLAIVPVAASASQPVSATQQQQAALRQLLTKYAYDQSHGADQATLSGLGKQIFAAAKALGQHVTLPTAPSAPNRSDESPASQASKINVTA